MTTPLATYCQNDDKPKIVRPLFMTPMISAPMTVPPIAPTPPLRLVPPSTTAAIASSSYPAFRRCPQRLHQLPACGIAPKLAAGDLTGAYYARFGAPDPDVGAIRGLDKLQLLGREEITGLVQLQQALKNTGLRDDERDVTYSIQRSVTHDRLSHAFLSVDAKRLASPRLRLDHRLRCASRMGVGLDSKERKKQLVQASGLRNALPSDVARRLLTCPTMYQNGE
jgi:hypothetical protein